MNLWQIACLVQVVVAHSWIDNIYVSSQPGVLGYPRNYAGHNADLSITQYKVLVNDPSTAACGPSQQSATYSAEYPMLVLPAGSEITATYLENGHVTKDKLPPDSLPHPGNYSWFLSSVDGSLKTFADLNDQTRISGPSPFDDGRCAVDASGIQGRPGPIDCLSRITIPASLAAGRYQLTWWWSFTKLSAIDASYAEYYTTCLDIQVTSSSTTNAVAAVPKLDAASVLTPKYSNTSFSAPSATIKALARPVQEQDVVVLSSAEKVVTSTFTYNHPTIVAPTTTPPSDSSVKNSLPTVAPVAVSTYSQGQVVQSMLVDPTDGSLSPLVLVADAHGQLQELPVSPTTQTSPVTAAASAFAATSVVADHVTIYVPTYITVDPPNCPAPPRATVDANSGTVVKRHARGGAVHERRQHHHYHHHQHHA
ncbi:protein of unknown function [Taphrina deformans PYCC 5710]|uniref:DUF7492 domain-containing protein n=1 Tax=Taphrina deformans (strain PYCC 5710 / ATCC 11124 / CBS 356.35 / IMI 108563 / JCM 9778 / NBRC 8474) TaxID=1097556 RepID=R4X9M5_TAPDE|nr:protein of unknown function [Taphrina deformans PYCC 5710]|eukprot:CCG82125.1 protein of unknown function [Taphrina deformans PYCC 5710]